MNNKLCVITGANSGIGYETAKAMASKGSYVVMVCRDEEKATEARSTIIDETGNEGVDIVLCDFAYQSDIRKAAQEIIDRFDQVDILINNHGFIAAEREETVDGLEKTFAVNHIGYFLFTYLLLDLIKKSDYARIISVSSEAHRTGEFDPRNLQLRKGFTPMKAYGNSKLFNILFTNELANRLADTHVTANCLHPGVVASGFASNAKWWFKWMFNFGKLFMISPEKGAETSIYLATSDEIKKVNGAYFKSKKVATPSKSARNQKYAKELWEISEKMCGL